MKILSLSNCPLNTNLGAGTVILSFVAGLRDHGHDVAILGPEDYGVWGSWPRAKQYGKAIGMAIQIVKAVLARRYDLIEVYGGEGWLGIWLAKRVLRTDVPILSHSNGIESHVEFCEQVWRQRGIDWHPRSWLQPNQKTLFDLGFRNADALIVMSEFDRKYAIEQKYQPEKRVTCIESGLPEVFLNRRISSHRDDMILYCGSWINRKNTRLMIEDVQKFLREHKSWWFTIAGGEPAVITPSFPEDVRGRVTVIQPVSRNELIQYYDRCAIFILPSFYESLGLVVAEAMSCGCAAILSRVGVGASLENLNQALLLDDPVSPNLYNALVKLAADSDLRQRISAGGYSYVQRLTWQRSTKKLLKVVETLVG